MAILFTSDLHLGHQHILSIREQFSTIEEHDEFLIQSWNNKITKKDEVYILGDVSYRISNISHYLDRMKGRKHLIIGNHDSYWMKHMKNDELFKYFETIDHLKVIKFDKKNPVPHFSFTAIFIILSIIIHMNTSSRICLMLSMQESILTTLLLSLLKS